MTVNDYHITQNNIIDSMHEMINRVSENYKRGYLTSTETDAAIENVVKSYMLVLNNMIVLLDK